MSVRDAGELMTSFYRGAKERGAVTPIDGHIDAKFTISDKQFNLLRDVDRTEDGESVAPQGRCRRVVTGIISGVGFFYATKHTPVRAIVRIRFFSRYK